jgi:hypothetical protein
MGSPRNFVSQLVSLLLLLLFFFSAQSNSKLKTFHSFISSVACCTLCTNYLHGSGLCYGTLSQYLHAFHLVYVAQFYFTFLIAFCFLISSLLFRFNEVVVVVASCTLQQSSRLTFCNGLNVIGSSKLYIQYQFVTALLLS